MAKLITAAIALATHGSDSEVVRLSAKAFRKHFILLGGLLGLDSLSSSSASPSSQQCTGDFGAGLGSAVGLGGGVVVATSSTTATATIAGVGFRDGAEPVGNNRKLLQCAVLVFSVLATLVAIMATAGGGAADKRI